MRITITKAGLNTLKRPGTFVWDSGEREKVSAAVESSVAKVVTAGEEDELGCEFDNDYESGMSLGLSINNGFGMSSGMGCGLSSGL